MDAYMNTLNQAANMSINTPRNGLQGSQQQMASPEEMHEASALWLMQWHGLTFSTFWLQEIQRQLDEFNRSVTIIIWYKANVEPIRLQQVLPTFPYFQLLRFNQLVEDLGLNPSSYLDTYIPSSGQWVQHTISSVRVVDTQDRLLYKVRRSLMEGLSEDECISLREEIQMQIQMQSRNGRSNPSRTGNSPSPGSPNKSSGQVTVKTSPDAQSSNPLKRSAPQGDNDENRQSPKIHVSNGYYMSHSGTSTMVSSPVSGTSQSNGSPSNVTSPQSPAQDQDGSVYMYQSFYGSSSGSQGSPEASTVLPHYLLSPQASAPIPYHPHPPLKRWPNDYTVSELSAGFHAMDLLISQSPTGANMTQRTAFERVFGSRYVKSTVCRHRAVWRKAPRHLREQFEAMGTDERACWGEFVRRVENRPPGKHSSLDLMSPTAGGSMGYHQSQNPSEEEDVHGQESVMNSIQNQVSSNQNNNTMPNNINVYDPSRSHLGNNGHTS